MKYVRVYAESTKSKDDYPLAFDLLLNDKGQASGDFYMLGLAGKPDEDGQCYPFALIADGSVDFGASYQKEDERWWKTDLRENKIEIGSAFKVIEQDDEYDYKIVKIDVLSE
jgi:hypothetical protein